MYKQISLLCLILLLATSCASKKDIWYMQDIDTIDNSKVNYTNSLIQPNDVLRITVSALNPEAAEIYNMQNNQAGGAAGGNNGAGMLALMGYLVTPDYTINFPILGELPVKNMTTIELSKDITRRLIDGGHLKNPTVDVRLVNAKFTVFGSAETAQTINFSEQNITLIQALGMVGGLDVRTIRNDVVVMREEKGVREVKRIDLTKTDWMKGPYYFIKPNDVILVKPNDPAVKQAGYINGPGALLGLIGAVVSLATLIVVIR